MTERPIGPWRLPTDPSMHQWTRFVSDNAKADKIHDHYEGQDCEWTDYSGKTYRGTVQTVDYAPDSEDMVMLYTLTEPAWPTRPDDVLFLRVSEIHTIELIW